jgi:hypothetical protein
MPKHLTEVGDQSIQGNLNLTGAVSSDNIQYDSDEDVNTFGGDVEVLGQLTAPNQNSLSPTNLITRRLLEGQDALKIFSKDFITAAEQTITLGTTAGATQNINHNLYIQSHNGSPTVGLTNINWSFPFVLESWGSNHNTTNLNGVIHRIGVSHASATPIPAGRHVGMEIRYTSTVGEIWPIWCINQSFNSINFASNSSPIRVCVNNNSSPQNGEWVRITGVEGNVAANGLWQVSNSALGCFDLTGSVGSGEYSSGGRYSITTAGPVYTYTYGTQHMRYFKVKWDGANLFLCIGNNEIGPISIGITANSRGNAFYTLTNQIAGIGEIYRLTHFRITYRIP